MNGFANAVQNTTTENTICPEHSWTFTLVLVDQLCVLCVCVHTWHIDRYAYDIDMIWIKICTYDIDVYTIHGPGQVKHTYNSIYY